MESGLKSRGFRIVTQSLSYTHITLFCKTPSNKSCRQQARFLPTRSRHFSSTSFGWKPFRLIHSSTRFTPDAHALRYSSSTYRFSRIIYPETTQQFGSDGAPSVRHTSNNLHDAVLCLWSSFNLCTTAHSRSDPFASRCRTWPLHSIRAHISRITPHLHSTLPRHISRLSQACTEP